MEERKNATEPVVPAPVGIACEGCRYGIEQTRSLGQGREVWWYCRLMHGWAWAGDMKEGYPEECGGWEPRESEE
jgi:hypothetical protein